MGMQRFAPAKINLGLHVLRKRSDGYHDIETVFLKIPWEDRLIVEPSESFSFTCSDPSLPVNKNNLCVKAAHGLWDIAGQKLGAKLHLEKHIPYGAGLGGGSSDAANTLLLLRDFWQMDVPYEELHKLASSLGSDVPFFLSDNTMYATGRGEVLEPLHMPGSGESYRCPFQIIVAVPDIHVSTAEAYHNITLDSASRPGLKELVASNDLTAWQDKLVNDFETTVFQTHPELALLKQQLYDAGAGYAAMSGSGSAVFGMFPNECRVPFEVRVPIVEWRLFDFDTRHSSFVIRHSSIDTRIRSHCEP